MWGIEGRFPWQFCRVVIAKSRVMGFTWLDWSVYGGTTTSLQTGLELDVEWFWGVAEILKSASCSELFSQ